MHRSFRMAAAARSAAIALRGGRGRVAVADVEAEWSRQFAHHEPPAPVTAIAKGSVGAGRVENWEEEGGALAPDRALETVQAETRDA